MAWTFSPVEDTPATRKATLVSKRAGFNIICAVSDGANKGFFCCSGLTFFIIQYATTNNLVVLTNAEAIALLFAYAASLP